MGSDISNNTLSDFVHLVIGRKTKHLKKSENMCFAVLYYNLFLSVVRFESYSSQIFKIFT